MKNIFFLLLSLPLATSYLFGQQHQMPAGCHNPTEIENRGFAQHLISESKLREKLPSHWAK